MKNEQIERIAEMEQHLDAAQAAVGALDKALDQYEAAQHSLAALSEYYGSESWRQDLADDEAGRLPQELKRGVLAEDGIWDVLEAWREVKERMGSRV